MSESANRPINPEAALSPAGRERAEEFHRRLGTLDPQQVAIWRQMTPAQKVKLAFQAWADGLNEIWTIERQRHPDATPEDLAQHVLRHLQEREMPYTPTDEPTLIPEDVANCQI